MHKTGDQFPRITMLLLLLTLFAGVGCRNREAAAEEKNNAAENVPVQKVDTDQTPQLAWTDSLVLRYIRSASASVEPELRDSLTYFFDRREISDTAHYLVYQIGHSSEGNFSTDHWLYLDSARKSAFEYDVVNDSLMRWPR